MGRCARGISLALAATLAVTSARAAAAPAVDLKAVGELVQAGQTRFETADYAGAIELWTKAYSALPEEPAHAAQRGVLVYSIAQACVEAYSLDPQVLYLRKAERLLVSYQVSLDPADAETRAAVQAQIDDLRAKIAEATPVDAPEVEPEPAPEPEPEPAAAPASQPAAAPAEAPRRSRPLAITGAVFLGVGAATLGAMAYGLAWGTRVDTRGEAAVAAGETDVQVFRDLLAEGTVANNLALGTGIASAVLVPTGAVLLGIGLSRRRGASTTAFAPLPLRRGAGAAVSVAF